MFSHSVLCSSGSASLSKPPEMPARTGESTPRMSWTILLESDSSGGGGRSPAILLSKCTWCRENRLIKKKFLTSFVGIPLMKAYFFSLFFFPPQRCFHFYEIITFETVLFTPRLRALIFSVISSHCLWHQLQRD